MEFFEKFVVSDAFFPVLIGLMIILVLVFVWILLSGKKKVENQTVVENVQNDEFKNESIPSEEVIPVNLDDTMVVKTLAINEEEQAPDIIETPNVVVDIPINKMDETPVEVTMPEDELNDVGETVVVEKTSPLVEDNVSQDEIVEIEMPMKKVEDVGESVELPIAMPLMNESAGETVELPVPKTLVSDVGEAAVAFESLPVDNREINENVKVEEPEEYLSEKTEIFDFPDFNDLETKDNEITNQVQEEAMRSAQEYVSTVFKEN